MLSLFLFSTFFTFFFIFFFSRFFDLQGTVYFLLYNNIVLYLYISQLFYKVCLTSKIFIYSFNFAWFSSFFLNVNWDFLFDSLSVTMFLVIILISSFVQLYSLEYLIDDSALNLFLSYLVLFEFFMLILIGACNFFVMFFGWEGVGLASFLLINFWYTRNQATKSAVKAMLLNRVGDFGLSIGIFIIYAFFKSIDFLVIFPIVPFFYDASFFFCFKLFYVLDLISFFLFIGVMGKSAQFGLHAWLPDAMEGPTPVSALLHAATMVTAGVFLMLRCSVIFEYAVNTHIFFIFIAIITTLFGAILAGFQYDLKKIIAYSTCSQIGLMIFACSLTLYNVALYHFFTHAFFKALLFLSAGSIIHAINGEQDLRYMRGLAFFLPFTTIAFYIGSLCLATSLFTSGFYSKDWFIHVASFLSSYSYNIDIYFFIWIIVGISGTYITNILYIFYEESFHETDNFNNIVLAKTNLNLFVISNKKYNIWFLFTFFNDLKIFFSKFKFNNNLLRFNNINYYLNSSESLIGFIFIVLWALSFLSIYCGYFFSDYFVGILIDIFFFSIQIRIENLIIYDFEFFTNLIDRFFMLLVISFDSIAIIILFNFLKKRKEFVDFIDLFFFFDSFFNKLFANFFFEKLHWIFYKEIDKSFFDNLGPTGLILFFLQLNSKIRSINTGYIYNYLYVIFFCLIFFILIVLLNNYFIITVTFDFIFFICIVFYIFILLNLVQSN